MWLWQILSSFNKSPLVREGDCLGPSATPFALASLSTWQCPLSPKAFGRAVSQAAMLRGRQEKAKNKITMQRAAQKIGGQSLLNPSDFHSFILIYGPGGPGWSLLADLCISFGWCTRISACWSAWAGHGLQKTVVSRTQAEMLQNTDRKPERSNKAGLRDLENVQGRKDSSETVVPMVHI